MRSTRWGRWSSSIPGCSTGPKPSSVRGGPCCSGCARSVLTQRYSRRIDMTEGGVFEPVQVYFDDLDAMGLLHNSRYALLVERAIGAYWGRLGWASDPVRSVF